MLEALSMIIIPAWIATIFGYHLFLKEINFWLILALELNVLTLWHFW